MGSDSESLSLVHFVAAQLVILVAVIHLALGAYNWIRWARGGFLFPHDLRWPLFVVSGLALVVGLFVAAAGRYRRPLYAGGILLMVVYVVGYFGWHLGGHRPLFIVGRVTRDETSGLQFVLDHLFAGPLYFVTIVSEVALALLLAYLLFARSE